MYERYGTTGSVRMVDVFILVDRELEEKIASCVAQYREAEVNIRTADQTAKGLRSRSPSAKEQAAVNEAARGAIEAEVRMVQESCSAALVKLQQNKRMFNEARERAKQ